MTLNRYAKRRDLAEPAIIRALEAAGIEVWPLDRPADLAVRRQSWPPGIMLMLEVKTGRAKTRKTQDAQRIFIESTRTPVVRTAFEALRAVSASEILT